MKMKKTLWCIFSLALIVALLLSVNLAESLASFKGDFSPGNAGIIKGDFAPSAGIIKGDFTPRAGIIKGDFSAGIIKGDFASPSAGIIKGDLAPSV